MPLPPGTMTPAQVFHLLKLVPSSRPSVNPTHNFTRELLAHLSKSGTQSITVQSGNQASLASGLPRQNIFVPFAPDTGVAAGNKNSTLKGNGKAAANSKNKRKKGAPTIG